MVFRGESCSSGWLREKKRRAVFASLGRRVVDAPALSRELTISPALSGELTTSPALTM